MKKNLFFLSAIFCGLLMLTSCLKEDYDQVAQAKKDDQLIAVFLLKNKLQLTKHESGLYYQIVNPGNGVAVTAESTVGVTYEGRLLNGDIFDSSNEVISFPLSAVIRGWTIGMQLIKPGGRIRLILPSTLAYGNQSPGAGIPKNSVLDFTIDLKYAK